jgi:hypothetical protein
MADLTKKHDLVTFLETEQNAARLMESKMIRYIHKQCTASGWLSSSDCHDPSKVGVIMKLEDDQCKVFPEELDPMMMEIICCLDARVALTMASNTTATLFRQISPYQTEIVVQPHGIKIPIVESLDEVLYLASAKKLKGYSCLVRREGIFLVWSNSIENILPHGAESEKLLMETVHFPSFALKKSRLIAPVVGRRLTSASSYDTTVHDSRCFSPISHTSIRNESTARRHNLQR